MGKEINKTSFWCLPLEATLKAVSTIYLPPFAGSTIRGSLGMALLKISCVLKHQRCNECVLAQRCTYTYIFETPLYGDVEDRKRFPNAPHPFVLDIGVYNTEDSYVVEKGEKFSFGFKLIGNGVDYLPHFLTALSIMGEMGIGKGRGKFEVEEVLSGGKRIYDGTTLHWPEEYFTLERATEEARSLPGDRVSISFVTPMRLLFRKNFVTVPEFHIIIGSLIQRIENLRRFHCGAEVPIFGKELIEKARSVEITENTTEWADWERYSHRKKRRMKLGGIVGSVSYEGDLSCFLPLIILGEWIHVGKGTSFGLGMIRRK